jgi:hypothetical protein
MRVAFASLAFVGATSCLDGSSDAFCGVMPEATAHACVHGEGGATGAIQAGWHSEGSAPTVSQTHQVLEASLVAVKPGLFAGELTFLPRRTGIYGFFVAPAALLEARGDDGTWRRLSVVTSETHCPHFAAAYLLPIDEEDPVVLSVAATPAPRVRILAERLGTAIERIATTECRGRPIPDAWAAPQDGAPDAGAVAGMDAAPDKLACRTSGPCVSDGECCGHCHDLDHCH